MSKVWWAPSRSREIQPVPWLAPDVISYLENLIQPDWEIIEHGSGGSTLWFAQRCKSVIAIEKNPDWQMVVREQASENVKVLSQIPAISFHWDCDLLLIDGEPVEDRRTWIADAPYIVRSGGWVVLDNANRPEYASERKALLDACDLIRTFDGNQGSTIYLVTEFYRVKKGGEL